MKKPLVIVALICSVVAVVYLFFDNHNAHYFGVQGQKEYSTGDTPFFMHPPYDGNINNVYSVRSTLLSSMAKRGHIEFYVAKFPEAEQAGADGVTLTILADGKEIVSIYENPYTVPEDKHIVTADFDIPQKTKLLSLVVSMNDNTGWDHTYIERLGVMRENPLGWALLLVSLMICMFSVWSLVGTMFKNICKTRPIAGMYCILVFIMLSSFLLGLIPGSLIRIISGVLFYCGFTGIFYAIILWAFSLCGFNTKSLIKEAFPLCVIVLVISAIFLSIVSRSRTVYIWDSGAYWYYSIQQGLALFESRPLTSLINIIQGINHDEYNHFIPAMILSLPLRVLGKSYIAYTILIFIMFAFPSAVILSCLHSKIEKRITTRSNLCLPLWFFALMLIMTAYYLPSIFAGMFDVAALVPISVLLFVTFSLDYKKIQIKKYICMALSCITIFLIRRHFTYFLVGYVLSLFFKVLTDFVLEKKDRRIILRNYALSMLFIGCICIMVIGFFFFPRLKMLLFYNYKVTHIGYKAALLDNLIRIVKSIGGIPLFFACIGLCSLFLNRQTRSFAVCLLSLSVSVVFLIAQTVSFNLQYYTVIVAQMAILVAGGIVSFICLLSKYIPARIPTLISGFVCMLYFLLLFFPTQNILFSTVTIRPKIRGDMSTLGSIIADVKETNKSMYVLSSSSNLNADILHKYNMPLQFTSYPTVLWSHEADMHDGFPVQLFSAGMVLVADPIQLHLAESTQEVVRIPAREILDNTGIGRKYRFVKEYALDYGIKAKLYELIEPWTKEDLEYLSGIFDKLYPNYPEMFKDRIMGALP